MNNKFNAIALSLTGTALGIAATWQGLRTVRYTVSSNKISNSLRFVVVSDLHSTRYGKNQNDLLNRLTAEDPDVIIVPGDMIDEDRNPAPAFTLLKQLVRIAPTYMVTGNHEYYGGRADKIIMEISSFGINLLCGDCLPLDLKGERINICGLEDPYGAGDSWPLQKENIVNCIDRDVFSVLISHRPDLVDDYDDVGADITVCGHAHGGQVIIPGLLNGLFAPNQGIFPKYAGGYYKLRNTEMFVCRGLMRSMAPRVFNPPEIAVIEVVGKDGSS